MKKNAKEKKVKVKNRNKIIGTNSRISFGTKLVWALLVSFPLSILASYIVYIISDKADRITIFHDSSERGGQTVIDLKIENSGDYDLNGLIVPIRFLKTVEMASVEPNDYRDCLKIKGNAVTFVLPESQVFMKSESIIFRFTSDGVNYIKNLSNLPNYISSFHISHEKVHGVWGRIYRLSDFIMVLFVFVLFIVIISSVVVFCFYKKQSYYA